MKNNKILYTLIGFLIVVNLFFLVNYLGHTKDKKKGHNRDFITKELNFDSSQMERFTLLKERHSAEVRAISDSITNLKEVLYTHISETEDSKEVVDTIIERIGRLEEEKDTKRFYHFRAIHDLCTDEQKERFKSLIKTALHRKKDRSSRHKD